LDWKSYEEVTKAIYQRIGEETGVKVLGSGSNFKVSGRSGVNHQIDVLTSHSDGIHQYLTDIECKYWNQKVDKDTIMKVHSIVEDCGFSKGVVVSKKGFTNDALTFAKSVDIGVVILREPTDEDWENRVKRIEVRIRLLTPRITEYINEVLVNDIDVSEQLVASETLEYIYPDGRKTSMDQIVEEFSKKLLHCTGDQHETIDFPKGTLLKSQDGEVSFEVLRVRIGGEMVSSGDSVEINVEDKVWLVMKAIFENKMYFITNDLDVRSCE